MSFFDNFKQESLVDLLKAYDSYISNAAEAGLLTTGWTPVCVEEFYQNEYQNVWNPEKGDESFDYMYEASESFSMEDDPTPVYKLEISNDAVITMEAGQLMVQFPDEAEKHLLRSRIQDIQKGDAFLIESGLAGYMVRQAGDDAHQNIDEPDCPWIVYDVAGDSWFEEDVAKADRVYGSQLHESLFIFEDELCVQDEELELIDGCLTATDGLVQRLKEQAAKAGLSQNAIDSMENMNFYPVYHPGNGTIELGTHFWHIDSMGKSTATSLNLPLTEKEASSLIFNMRSYCAAMYQKTCEAFVLEAKEAYRTETPPIPVNHAHVEVADDLQNKLDNTLLDGEYGTFIDVCVEIPLSYSVKPDHILVVWGEENSEEDKFYSLSIYKKDEKGEPTGDAISNMQIFSESASFEDLRVAVLELLARFDKLPAAEKTAEKRDLDSIISGAQHRASGASDRQGNVTPER